MLVNIADIRFYLAALLPSGVAMLLGFGLYSLIRLRLAEQRYQKKRAQLAKSLNRVTPLQLTPKHRISLQLNPQSSQWTSAEQQIYALQEAHYAELKRDKNYHAAIHRILVDAPKAEQAYLRELVQLEQRWLSQRQRYRNIKPDYYYHPERPDEDGSYPIRFELNGLVALVSGLGIVGFGIWTIWKDSAALLNSMALIAMGFVVISISWELHRTKSNVAQAEQHYRQQQSALAKKHGRFTQ